MRNPIDKSKKWLNRIIDIQQLIANLSLIIIMTIVTFDVLGRNVFNSPIKGSYELVELGTALLVFFAFAMTHRYEEHIAIDFVVEKFPEKVRRILHGIVEIAIGIILFFMARHIFDNGMRMMERHSTTTDLSIPVHPFLFIITFTLVIFGLTAIFKALYHFRLAVNKE